MQCKCGNELGALATSCPKCGQTYVGKTAGIVLLFIILFGGFIIFMLTKYS